MPKVTKGDLAYQRDKFLLDFIDSNCSNDLSEYKTKEQIRAAIDACDEGLADWYSIISPDDPIEIQQSNRRSIQRLKREKTYLKRKLKEFLRMENNEKGGNASK